jgi:HEAT repeat protein
MPRCTLVPLLVVIAGCSSGVEEPKSAAELAVQLRGPTPEGQLEAARTLDQYGAKAGDQVPALIEALTTSNEVRVRQLAASTLGKIGVKAKDAVPALTSALADPNYDVQQAAADALGAMGPEAQSAIPALEKMSQGKDPCKSAEMALQKIR